MMANDGVDTIDLPFTDERWDLYNNAEDDSIEDRGEFCAIPFDKEEQSGRAAKSRPRVANTHELKVAYLRWLKENTPEKLECKFEARMKEEGYKILWTPPYCPKLQPIEVFWANGKNHVADMYDNNTSMKDVVRRVQDGWYGNEDQYERTHCEYTPGTNCAGLVKNAIDSMDKEFIPLSPGLEGRIGELTIDTLHEQNKEEIPIDYLVVDLTKELDPDEETGGDWF